MLLLGWTVRVACVRSGDWVHEGLQFSEGGFVVRVYWEIGLPHSDGLVQLMVREEDVQETGVMVGGDGGPGEGVRREGSAAKDNINHHSKRGGEVRSCKLTGHENIQRVVANDDGTSAQNRGPVHVARGGDGEDRSVARARDVCGHR